ncbi:MAG: hypothetical protein EPO20_13640 [Betaproteobacteria bacterium]|nr:MAG: hypothetical protein EPO20_13640 [Betaproteobacteria bacterium]
MRFSWRPGGSKIRGPATASPSTAQSQQEESHAVHRDASRWTSMSIANVARMGRFSADRTVREYAAAIWGV